MLLNSRGNFENIPDWFWFDPFLSPMDGYQTASMLAFDIFEAFGIRSTSQNGSK